MGRRILNRKELRDNFDAAERRTEDEERDEDEEEGDEDEDEEEGDEEAPAAEDEEEADADEEAGDEDDEDAPKKKKKKKVVAKPKVKAPAKSRTRVAKVVRMRVLWGVYDNSHRLVATFDYPKKSDAEAHAAKLMADKRSTHFVQPLKEAIEEPKKEK